jgi:putative peptidoglycan lipid II flippase
MDDGLPVPAALADETRGIARSASIIALGNVTSRALGFVRDSVMASLFGAGAHVDALALAIIIPNQLNDLLTGGLVNSALVPVFSEYAAVDDRRRELWRLASSLLTVVVVVVSVVVALLLLFTPQVVAVFALLGGGNNPEAMAQAVPLLRLTLPAVLFLSLSGVLSGLLNALRRFAYPAFTVAIFNASIAVVSLLLAWRLDVRAAALGLLVGAALQVVLQLPGLRDGLSSLRPLLDLRHPGLRRIFRLYLPIVGSLIVSQASVLVGLGLAWGFVGGVSWMRYATTLYQFPLGLVAVAVSSAILPTLSRQAAQLDAGFTNTLVRGLNLVLALILPATVGLFVLAHPVVALAFERGEFTPLDTLMTALVLQVFLLGLAFAAVDQILIYAYYARQNTLVPALVGVLSIGVYIAVALLTLRPLGLFSLMLADSVKQITHAMVMGALVSRRVGGFRRTNFWPTLGRVLLASLVMAVLTLAALWAVQRLALPSLFMQRLLEAAVPGLVGVVSYFWLAERLNVSEVRLAVTLVRQRLGL